MALIRANNKTIQNVTTLPTGVTEYNLESGDLPADSIIQTLHTFGARDSGISTTSYVAVGLDLNITPKYNGSKFIIHCFWLLYDSGGSATFKGESALYRDTTQVYTLTHTPYHNANLGGFIMGSTGAIIDTPGAIAGTSIAYSWKFKKDQAGEQSYRVSHNDERSSWIMVQEIKQ